jgi:hypothetical protein
MLKADKGKVEKKGKSAMVFKDIVIYQDLTVSENFEFFREISRTDAKKVDSIMKSIGIDVPAVSVSSLEDVSIQKIHKQIGVISLPPAVRADGTRWNKQKLIQEFGFSVLSKEIARKIELLQNPTPNNKTIRHAIVTGETGEYGGFQKHSKMKLAQKWLEKFGGLENEEEGVNYQIAPFKVSSKCCYYLRKSSTFNAQESRVRI